MESEETLASYSKLQHLYNKKQETFLKKGDAGTS